jgi:hypothetical protein
MSRPEGEPIIEKLEESGALLEHKNRVDAAVCA